MAEERRCVVLHRVSVSQDKRPKFLIAPAGSRLGKGI